MTDNGEAKVVARDNNSYEVNENTFALLNILALGNNQIEQGNITPANSAIDHIRQRRERHIDKESIFI